MPALDLLNPEFINIVQHYHQQKQVSEGCIQTAGESKYQKKISQRIIKLKNILEEIEIFRNTNANYNTQVIHLINKF